MQGGDLLVCDSCIRSFHTACLEFDGVPEVRTGQGRGSFGRVWGREGMQTKRQPRRVAVPSGPDTPLRE